MTPEAIEIGIKLQKLSRELRDAERLYAELEGSKKSLIAELKRKSSATSNTAKEDDAYASDDYKSFVKGLAEAESNRNFLRREYEIGTLKWHALKRDEEREEQEQRRVGT